MSTGEGNKIWGALHWSQLPESGIVGEEDMRDSNQEGAEILRSEGGMYLNLFLSSFPVLSLGLPRNMDAASESRGGRARRARMRAAHAV